MYTFMYRSYVSVQILGHQSLRLCLRLCICLCLCLRFTPTPHHLMFQAASGKNPAADPQDVRTLLKEGQSL